jgi:hypothetical protein
MAIIYAIDLRSHAFGYPEWAILSIVGFAVVGLALWLVTSAIGRAIKEDRSRKAAGDY